VRIYERHAIDLPNGNPFVVTIDGIFTFEVTIEIDGLFTAILGNY